MEMGHETDHDVAGEGRLKEKVEHRRTIWAALNATVNQQHLQAVPPLLLSSPYPKGVETSGEGDSEREELGKR